jgi:formylglycine-generating enzyme required for sulfatase activity
VSLSPAQPPLSTAGAHASPERPLRARLALGAAALLGGAIVFAAVNLPRPHGGGDSGAAARSIATGAAAAAAVVPPPATCASGTVKIPGGKFFMGSDDGLPMERPSHNVTLSPFCIDVHETTTEDYKACSDKGECKRAGATNDWDGMTDAEHKAFDPLCNVRDPEGRAKHPINCVDWEMATIFCKAHGKRLPTEAEWEFAARGPDGRRYPWGDEEPGPTLLNACGKDCVDWGRKNRVDTKSMYSADDGWATTAPVGTFPKGASRYGLQDVVGNVWEWVADYYAEYPKSDLVDPSGPATGDERVIRGGAWNGAYAAWVRPTFRYKDTASKRSYGIGFRCASSL